MADARRSHLNDQPTIAGSRALIVEARFFMTNIQDARWRVSSPS